MTEMSEQDSWEIDPLEKDWMLASAQADLQVRGDTDSVLSTIHLEYI